MNTSSSPGLRGLWPTSSLSLVGALEEFIACIIYLISDELEREEFYRLKKVQDKKKKIKKEKEAGAVRD